VSYTAAEGKERVLDDLADAADQLALAVARLGEAYEQLDERHADELEQVLFRPVQLAYGRAQRTHAEFARRSGLPGRLFEPQSPGLQSQSARELIEGGADAAAAADQLIGALQDSMLPVEVGDPELRAGLAEVRRLVAGIPARALEVIRTVGR
jgi:hypothetical protein